jgi:hypothetical protein
MVQGAGSQVVAVGWRSFCQNAIAIADGYLRSNCKPFYVRICFPIHKDCWHNLEAMLKHPTTIRDG